MKFDFEYLKQSAKALFSLAIISAIFFFVDTNKLWLAAEDLSISVIAVGLFINIFGSVVCNSAQIYSHIKSDMVGWSKTEGFLQVLKIDFVVRFYSLFIPAGATAAIRWHRFVKLGVGSIYSGSAIIANKLLQVALIAIFTSLAFLYFDQQTVSLETKRWTIIVSATLSAFTMLILLLMLKGGFKKEISSTLHALLKMKIFINRKDLSNKILDHLNIYNSTFNPTNKREILALIGWALMSYILTAYSQYLILIESGIGLTFLDALFIRGITLLALIIPFSIAGIGIREAGTVGALSLYGAPIEVSLLVSTVFFGYQLMISMVGGFLEALIWLPARLIKR